MNVLSLTYLGNLQWFSRLLSGDCIVDVGENYRKQSYRTRCEIMSPGGVTTLSVQVRKPANWPKSATKDIRLDYSKRWQHQHWNSMVAAYASSPYFDHFAEFFAPFYEQRYEFLYDFNRELLELSLRLIGSEIRPQFSETYIDPVSGICDLRDAISPKSATVDESFSPAPYYQVFSDHMPFAPNLSIVDLIFCEGRGTLDILRRSATI